MNWEKQLGSMLASDCLDKEAMDDLAVAYAEETGDDSFFEIDPIILMSINRHWYGDGSISCSGSDDYMNVSTSEFWSGNGFFSCSSGSYRSVGKHVSLEWSFSGSSRFPMNLRSISLGSG